VRVVFLGTPVVAVRSLQALHAAGHEVPLVVTRPDRPRGRSGRALPPPVKSAAAELGFEILQPTRVRGAAFVEELRRREPRVLVVVAYGRILPKEVLAVASAGVINVHFSLLPKYRGAAPVQWALANGECVTGVTTMQVVEELDAGDVLMQCELRIEPGEHAPDLERRLSGLGARLLVDTLTRLDAGKLEPLPQDPALVTHAPLLRAAHGAVDPGLDARQIEGRIRGFDPWPGVWVARAGRRLRLVEAVDTGRIADGSPPPGQILGVEGEGILLACGGGTVLCVRRVQPAGRRVMPARDAINGRQLAIGDRLERPASA
jgi:methionyl-tRNA formyltransferase